MIRLPRKSSFSVIGVDIGAAAMKAVQLCREGRNWRIFAAARLDYPAGTPFDGSSVELFGQALRRQRFSGNRIALAARGGDLRSEILEAPPADSGAPVRQIAEAEFVRGSKWADGSFELEYWPLPSAARAGGSSLMAVGLQHRLAEALLTPFDQTDLDVVAIDVPVAALARAAVHSGCPGESLTALVDLGASAASVALLLKGSTIYHRLLPECGLAALHRGLAEGFELSPDELSRALETMGLSDSLSPSLSQAPRFRQAITRHCDVVVDQLESALQYARHRHPGLALSGVMIAGGGGAVRGIDQYLQARFRVPTRLMTAESILHRVEQSSANERDPSFATAIGVALRGSA